ncbi:uncharacterized protein UBRO_12913 [Ustilago bromivora]|uniref:Uncharacterized protein n=1 Tax=Ustilago bromivora TaxID=307758 RepID=A0A1K0FV90_9BASI|nr:uncharacterized protein UBRO_12913 [Ustilago bromivora]
MGGAGWGWLGLAGWLCSLNFTPQFSLSLSFLADSRNSRFSRAAHLVAQSRPIASSTSFVSNLVPSLVSSPFSLFPPFPFRHPSSIIHISATSATFLLSDGPLGTSFVPAVTTISSASNALLSRLLAVTQTLYGSECVRVGQSITPLHL